MCGNVNVIPVSVSSASLESAEEQRVRLSGVVSVLPGKKVLVPEDMWRGRPEMMRPRLLAQLGRFRSVLREILSFRESGRRRLLRFWTGVILIVMPLPDIAMGCLQRLVSWWLWLRFLPGGLG